MCLLFEVSSDAILGNDEKKKINSQNGTDKINLISENPTKIKVKFYFTRSLMYNSGNLGCACAHVFQK